MYCCSIEGLFSSCASVKFQPAPEVNITVIEYHNIGNGLYQIQVSCNVKVPTKYRHNNALLAVIVNSSFPAHDADSPTRWSGIIGGTTSWFVTQNFSVQVYPNSSLACRVQDSGRYESSETVIFLPTISPPSAKSDSHTTTIILISAVPSATIIIIAVVYLLSVKPEVRRRLLVCLRSHVCSNSSGFQHPVAAGNSQGTIMILGRKCLFQQLPYMEVC